MNALILVGAGYLVWFSVNHGWSKARLLLVLAGPLIVWVIGATWLRDKSWIAELRDSLTPGVWEITKNKDGTYDILHAGKLLRPFVPNRCLYDALKGYGFLLVEQENIERQLDGSEKATITWRTQPKGG